LQKAGTADESLSALSVFLRAWVAAQGDIESLNSSISAPAKQSTSQWLVKASSALFCDYLCPTFLSGQTRQGSFPFQFIHLYTKLEKENHIVHS
jgi:hypothetical protein